MAIRRSKGLQRSNFDGKDWDVAAVRVQQIRALRQVNADWFRSLPARFDVAVSLHRPNAFRAERGTSERAFQYTLRSFFTRLDRRVLRSACNKRGAKIPRYVVLENVPSLGWHMHAMLSSETGAYSAEQLCTTVKLMWLEEFAGSTLKGFEPYLGWAEVVTGGYENYLSKDLYGPHATAVFDEMNTVFEPPRA